MYYVCKPTKIAIYVNTGYKSATQIQRELGCDALINGGLYDMTKFVPYCWLRQDGRTLRSEQWSDWGFGWDTDKLTMDTSDNVVRYLNFISCVSIIKDGAALHLSYPVELGGRRGRSAIGVKADGSVILFCTKDGTEVYTPEELQTKMLSLGAVSALMLDSGGSSQCITPVGKVQSSRIVHNFIAIWTSKDPQTQNPQCPYSEPTHNVGRWCIFYSKDEARWVQWMLREKYDPKLEVDGSFGKLSDAALRGFQRANGLDDDGVCGPLTREELKR